MGYFRYVSDDGNTYKMKLDNSNGVSAGGTNETGGVAGTDPWYPRGWFGRYILCENSSYPRRKVVCPDPTAGVWVGGTTTIALQVAGVATSPTFNISGRIGEKRTARG
jgi:hypothetical protein